jgi:hypothetical protein
MDLSRKPKRLFPLYHRSPSDRREKIARRGLRLACSPVTHSQKFQYLCWSDSPSLAWALSATHSEVEGDWDLYMTWSTHIGRIERRTDLGHPTEWRSFENVPKAKIRFVGTRRHIPRRKRK